MSTAVDHLQLLPDIDPDLSVLGSVTRVSEDAFEIMESILWGRLKAMRNRMQRLLAQSRGNTILTAAADIYNGLSPVHRARVLVSSEFCECYSMIHVDPRFAAAHARSSDDDQILFQMRLYDIVSREKALADLEAGSVGAYLRHMKTDRIYSPLGDKVAVRGDFGRWCIERAPSIGEVITVDFDSPVARNYEARSGILSQKCLDFTSEEKRIVVEKLQTALEQIDAVEPAYGFLIRNFVRRIIVRKSIDSLEGPEEFDRVFGSEHVPRQPGSFRMLNTHLPDMTADACMESIMHESTHNFLAAWELANGPFVMHNQKDRPVSPWSGNGIPNSSFIHAAFIYFICHRMYVRHLASLDLSESARVAYLQKRLAKFVAGYLIPHHVCDQLVLPTPLPKVLRDIIGSFQEEIKATYAERAMKEGTL
jgi:hypothetical protein